MSNFSIYKCVDFHDKYETLDENSLKEQQPLLQEMAKIWETNEKLKKVGLHKDTDEMMERWFGAGLPDPYLYKITKGDLSIIQDHVNTTGKMMYDKGFGFDSAGSDAKVLRSRLKWLPGGEEIGADIEQIVSFQRSYTEANKKHLEITKTELSALAELTGVDFTKLAKLETDYMNAVEPGQRNEILYGKGGINELLGSLTNNSTKTTAGEIIRGIRDIYEGASINDLVWTNPKTKQIEPWTPQMRQHAQKMKNSYYSIRETMLGGALSGLRRLKGNARRLDENRRRKKRIRRVYRFN